MNSCRICNSTNNQKLGSVGVKAAAVTSDSALINSASVIWKCNECGHLQKFPTNDDWKTIDKVYATYAGHRLSSGGEQVVFRGGLPPRPRSYHALEQCLSYLPSTGDLLDYGAAEGAILKSAGKLLPGWRLHAYDLTDLYKEKLLGLPGVVSFTSGNPEALFARKYDLVVLWHSLEHVDNPNQLLGDLKRLLKPGGHILVQVPDVSRNPFDLGVIDHLSHFTEEALMRCAFASGLRVDLNGREWTHNCISYLMSDAGSLEALKAAVTPAPDTAHPYRWLNSLIESLATKLESKPYAIFGTGMASLLLASQLPGRPQFYLDEDLQRAGMDVGGVMIHGPGQTLYSDRILMPFHEGISRGIIDRLVTSCPRLRRENFICAG